MCNSSAQYTNHKSRLSQWRSYYGGHSWRNRQNQRGCHIQVLMPCDRLFHAPNTKQAIVWNHDTVAQPVIQPPESYTWKQEDDKWTPVMTTQILALGSVLHLVKCGCKKQCRSGRCSDAQMLCGCSGDDEDAREITEPLVLEEDETDDDAWLILVSALPTLQDDSWSVDGRQ